MTLALRRMRENRSVDDGYTLMDLLVSMFLFGILMVLITGATTIMYKDVQKQQGKSNDLSGSRKAVLLLDKQIRYSNAINTPGYGTTGKNYYVEWRTGNSGQQQSCTQWRYVPAAGTITGTLQFRTWQEAPAALSLSNWITEATGVGMSGSTVAFSLTPPEPGVVVSPSVGYVTASHQQLTVTFTTTAAKTTNLTSFSLTSLDSTVATAPSPSICSEEPRP